MTFLNDPIKYTIQKINRKCFKHIKLSESSTKFYFHSPSHASARRWKWWYDLDGIICSYHKNKRYKSFLRIYSILHNSFIREMTTLPFIQKLHIYIECFYSHQPVWLVIRDMICSFDINVFLSMFLSSKSPSPYVLIQTKQVKKK